MGVITFRHQDRINFYKDCVVECTYKSNISAYYKVTYKNEVIKFCVSDHHGIYRGNLITIISKKRTKNKIKQIAWDIIKSK